MDLNSGSCEYSKGAWYVMFEPNTNGRSLPHLQDTPIEHLLSKSKPSTYLTDIKNEEVWKCKIIHIPSVTFSKDL